MIAVIADDLTGASDAGVQFARRGLDTHVLFDVCEPAVTADVDVLVIDTDSRALSPEAAYARVRNVGRTTARGIGPTDDPVATTALGQTSEVGLVEAVAMGIKLKPRDWAVRSWRQPFPRWAAPRETGCIACAADPFTRPRSAATRRRPSASRIS